MKTIKLYIVLLLALLPYHAYSMKKNNLIEQFFHAIESGDQDKVRQLITTDNTLITSKNYEGWTPLCFAALNNQITIVELLLQNNVSVTEALPHISIQYPEKTTALMIAIKNHYNDIATLLIDKSTIHDLNITDDHDYNALMYAVLSKDIILTKKLVEKRLTLINKVKMHKILQLQE